MDQSEDDDQMNMDLKSRIALKPPFINAIPPGMSRGASAPIDSLPSLRGQNNSIGHRLPPSILEPSIPQSKRLRSGSDDLDGYVEVCRPRVPSPPIQARHVPNRGRSRVFRSNPLPSANHSKQSGKDNDSSDATYTNSDPPRLSEFMKPTKDYTHFL